MRNLKHSPHFLKKKKRNEKKYTFSNKRNLWWSKNIRLADLAESIQIDDWSVSILYHMVILTENDYLYKTQEHPATIFCKITVRRSKYCLEISKAWEELKISG